MLRLVLASSLAVIAATASCTDETPARSRPPTKGLDPVAYDRWRRPERVIDALALAPGQRVADVGAGTGYFTVRLARSVGPAGKVVATDIDRDAVAALTRLASVERSHSGMAPIEARLVAANEPSLEPAAYDRILLAQVDHLLPDRVAYLRQLRGALAPGGRLAISNRIYHRTAALEAATATGFRTVNEVDDLSGQFMVLLAPAEEQR